MATIEECRSALDRLSHNLAGADGKVARAAAVDRSVSCAITDLGVTFTGRLSEGGIRDVVPVRGAPAGRADIRLTMSGDDLVALVDGRLNFATSWATGRVKLEAGLRDLLRLRTLL